MIEPPKEYQIIKNYIDKEKMPLSGYIYFLFKIPKDFVEWLIRYLPGSVGVIIRRLYYKMILKKVGSNVVIDEGVYFIGNNIELDDWCYIDKFCVFRSYSKIRVGKRVHVSIGVVIHAGTNSEVIIDDYSGIASYSCIYSLSNAYAPNKRMGGPMVKSHESETRSGKIYIGKECFLGVGVLVLPNVKIGFGAVIAAGATVKKNVKELGVYDKDLKIIREREFDSKLYYKE